MDKKKRTTWALIEKLCAVDYAIQHHSTFLVHKRPFHHDLRSCGV